MNSDEIASRINAIRLAVKYNATPYEKGKELAQPFLDELNLRVRQIAKKYGMASYRIFNFAGFGLRNF